MVDEFNNPFKALKKSKKIQLKDDPNAEKRRKEALKPPPEPAQDPYDDADLFLQAMGGVSRVKKKGGRQVHKDNQLEHTPMEGLRKKKAAKAPAAPEPKQAPEAKPKPDLSEEDAEDLFLQEMGDVAPMDGKGRDVPVKPKPVESSPAKSAEALAKEHLRDLVSGKIEFEVEHTEEYTHGQVAGLDPKIFNKLRAGAYSYEAHIDLHGMNAEQALYALADFVKLHYQMGRRTLLVVTGRGKNSPDGRGVIRNELQHWLTHEPFKRVVLAYVTAQPKDGGPGAVYVMLRKYKKVMGKVQWDKLPKDWMYE